MLAALDTATPAFHQSAAPAAVAQMPTRNASFFVASLMKHIGKYEGTPERGLAYLARKTARISQLPESATRATIIIALKAAGLIVRGHESQPDDAIAAVSPLPTTQYTYRPKLDPRYGYAS